MSYGPADSPATVRILGIFSKAPGSAAGATSCSASACRRLFGAEVIMLLQSM